MIINLTDKQIEGIKIAKQRFRNKEDYTCISGYAGSGKSTLIKYLISELDIPKEKIAYACFTGKAALVLQQKGQPATTLHKLLYRTFKNKNGDFSHIPKEELDEDYELIVIDEVSMCPAKIWQQALKHKIHIIALGDPFQLPPIGDDNGVLANPHVFLDEVMRQALESDIIKLSMDIRAGKPLQLMNGNDVKVISRSQLVSGMYTWADQIICGTNATRRMVNAQMRNMLNRGPEPEVGDKVICLKNYWDTMNGYGDALINGMIGEITDLSLGSDQGVLGREMKIDFKPDFIEDDTGVGEMTELNADYKLITTGNATFAKNARPIFRNGKKQPFPMEFDYGYCITCHKAQGSQFNKVLLFEEVLNSEMHARWLYTAITRAVDKIVLVKRW